MELRRLNGPGLSLTAYQRNISEKGMRQIRRIIEGFDWASFKPQSAPWTTSAERDLAADMQSHLTGEYLGASKC